ncbi:MAG: AmmeMemoRadiSam system radical SAM enzyme [Candidatus Anammoxibacter sp.]
MKEAMIYKSIDHETVQCHLCPHNCVILEGNTGFCGVRQNKNGKLYALTYGLISSAAIDPIEKKPLYHFYPGTPTMSVGTFGCNMRCKHCQNWEISHHKATEDGAGMQKLSPDALVRLTKERKCDILVWTYNEPSIWFEYIMDTAKLARKEGILTVMVTSGMINPPALKILLKNIDAYRLDIKGFSEEFYQNLTGKPVLKNVLENALIAYNAGIHIEIITNVIPGWNDSDDQFDGLSKWIVNNMSSDIPWHLTAYHPDNKLKEPPTPIDTLKRGMNIGHDNGLKYIYLGNIPGHTGQNTICPGCTKTLIDRIGFGVGENHIVKGCCKFCGYQIKSYCGPDVPFRRHTYPYPEHVDL